MKTWTIMLTAGFVLAAIPFVTAEKPCSRAEVTDFAVARPGDANSYIYFDVTGQPDKVGQWTEANQARGLQTVPCFSLSGVARYAPDQKAAILG